MCKERTGSLIFCTESRVSDGPGKIPGRSASPTRCGVGGRGTVPSYSREEGRTKEGAPSLQPQGEAVPPLGLEGGQGSGIC